MSRWNLAWLLGVSAITLLGLSLSFSSPSTSANLYDKHENISLLIDVLEEVEGKYTKKLDKEQMREFVENAINGALEKLDEHSAFMNREEYEAFQKHSHGEFSGVGIRITVSESGNLVVETPLVGTPAYNAGILPGDTIVAVDGERIKSPLKRKELNDVVGKIQGKEGTTVTLTVVSEGSDEERDVELTRARIHVDSVMGDVPLPDESKKWEYFIDKENRVAYVRIESFGEQTVDELTKVINDLQEQGMRGLIIDLRNNPGGLLRSAVHVSSMFLEPGKKIVSTKGRDKEEEVYYARPPQGFQPVLDVPLVLLLNRYSASASEIVAAALKDHLRAIIIGERSYGKGSVQNVIELENGATALKLTTASYWRPSGKNIHRFPESEEEDDWGVKPDIEVKMDTKELINYFKYRREKDILHKPGGKKPDKEALDFKDRVLEKAKEHILKEIRKKSNGKQGAARKFNPFGLQNAHHHESPPWQIDAGCVVAPIATAVDVQRMSAAGA